VGPRTADVLRETGMTDSQWVVRDRDTEPKAFMCSGVLPIPQHHAGMMLQCTKQVTLTGLVDKKERVYAEPGDLCIVISISDTYGWTGFTPNYNLDVMFLSGGSMSLSRRCVEEQFQVLKGFPRKLSDMRKYRYKPD